ncbi:MAG: DUF3313 domain-containing protein [Verrucomicrobiota bacterium JB024]|nr:DUF3313 domain-containing protein [Verrucomicrobiota bacterium JB024]
MRLLTLGICLMVGATACLHAQDSGDDESQGGILGGGVLGSIRDRVNARTQTITDNSAILSSTSSLNADAQPGPAQQVVSTVTDPIKEGMSDIMPTKASPMTKSGFLPSYEGFKEDPDTGAWVWRKEEGVLAQYNRFIISPIIVYPANDSEFKGISPDDLKKLTDYFRAELTQALDQAGYPVVFQPGKGVAVVRIAIVGVVPGNPVMYAGSWMPYARIADAANQATGGTPMGVGSISIEAELLDSLTGAREGAVIDTLAGKKLEVRQSMNKWGDIAQAVQTWAQRFAARVTKAHGGDTDSDS